MTSWSSLCSTRASRGAVEEALERHSALPGGVPPTDYSGGTHLRPDDQAGGNGARAQLVEPALPGGAHPEVRPGGGGLPEKDTGHEGNATCAGASLPARSRRSVVSPPICAATWPPGWKPCNTSWPGAGIWQVVYRRRRTLCWRRSSPVCGASSRSTSGRRVTSFIRRWWR